MFLLESEQLILLALDFESLSLLKSDRVLLEKHLALDFTGHKVSPEIQIEIKRDLRCRIQEVYENAVDYLWYTSWEIILKVKNQSVGAIGLTGIPDENGETMLGYYIDERNRNNGFASEAIKTLTKWAFLNKKLIQINAYTQNNNISSQKVLQKNGFILAGNDEDLMHWKLKRNTKNK